MAKTIQLRLRHDEPSPAKPTPPTEAGVKARWQFRRDLVICLAFRQGYSRKYLADVFDVHRSKINVILDNLSVYGGTEAIRDPSSTDDPLRAAPAPPPAGATPGQRRRHRRNVLIYMTYR